MAGTFYLPAIKNILNSWKTKEEGIYFTLTGTRYYHGNEFLKPGMKLKLKKEPDNKFDKETIVVKKEGLGECRLYWLSCLRA